MGFKSSSSASSTVNQQVGAETGETSGDVAIVGASGVQSSGGLTLNRSNLIGQGSHDTVNISEQTLDPEVAADAIEGGALDTATAANAIDAATGSALTSNTDVADTSIAAGTVDTANALTANTEVSGAAQQTAQDAINAATSLAGGAETVAAGAIQAGVTDTANADAFGELALQAAENAQATSTTALENESAQYAAGLSDATANDQIAANNATTGAYQPLNTGLVQPGTGISLSTVATWVAIVAGLISIIYFLVKRKP